MIIEDHRLDEFITASHAPRQRTDVQFLNLAFRPTRGRRMPGAGIYAIFFTPPQVTGDASGDERLIYVGKYLGKRDAPFGGNVLRDRWWAHSGTLTMRGYRLSVTKSVVSHLRANLHDDATGTSHVLIQAAETSILTCDNGCVSGKNRIRFAQQHWSHFGNAEPEEILRPFRIIYARFGEMPASHDVESLRSAIGSVERELIMTLRPWCNGDTGVGEHRDDVSPENFRSAAQNLLAAATR